MMSHMQVYGQGFRTRIQSNAQPACSAAAPPHCSAMRAVLGSCAPVSLLHEHMCGALGAAFWVVPALQCHKCFTTIARGTRAHIQPEKRLAMARDIAKGMAYLHGRTPAIIHGDLKSLNLLVDCDLGIKVGTLLDVCMTHEMHEHEMNDREMHDHEMHDHEMHD
eukprot:353397-Chlamydomonas_euryale.AAC.1